MRNQPIQALMAALVALLYVAMAAQHEPPVVMFVGLAPMALVAAEAAWCLVRLPAGE